MPARSRGILTRLLYSLPNPCLRTRVREVLAQAGGRPGHIFNLGHGIVPGTPVENVQRVVRYVREYAREQGAS